VLIRDHHPGYITWEHYERNLRSMEANAFMKSGALPKAGRGGRALLSGLLRCRRCGRLMNVYYRGGGETVARYVCRGGTRLHADCLVSLAGPPMEQRVVSGVTAPRGDEARHHAIGRADKSVSLEPLPDCGRHKRGAPAEDATSNRPL
jgi:hypothetical protein